MACFARPYFMDRLWAPGWGGEKVAGLIHRRSLSEIKAVESSKLCGASVLLCNFNVVPWRLQWHVSQPWWPSIWDENKRKKMCWTLSVQFNYWLYRSLLDKASTEVFELLQWKKSKQLCLHAFRQDEPRCWWVLCNHCPLQALKIPLMPSVFAQFQSAHFKIKLTPNSRENTEGGGG